MLSSKLISARTVSFKLKDAVCPDFVDVVRAIGSELEVTGKIVYFSDGCNQREYFAIVEVVGVNRPFIVPVEHLESVTRLVEEPPWQNLEDHLREARGGRSDAGRSGRCHG